MGRVRVYGGDFANGRAWFDPGTGFVLCGKDGKRESIPVTDLVAVDGATEQSIRAFGGDEGLVQQLYRIPPSDKTGGLQVFIASLDDGRLLLASVSPKSYKAICAARRPARASEPPEPEEDASGW
jgi:hypothetical protein